MGVVEASSEMGFDEATAGLTRSCIFFWAAWHEPSKPGGQMDQVGVWVCFVFLEILRS